MAHVPATRPSVASYHLGRWFAVIEQLERDSSGDHSADHIRHYSVETFAHPAAYFDRLMHLTGHWLQMAPETIRADRETLLHEILARDDNIPHTFTDSQRVLFTLGYYHQAHAMDKPQFVDFAIKFLLPGRSKPVLVYPVSGRWRRGRGSELSGSSKKLYRTTKECLPYIPCKAPDRVH